MREEDSEAEGTIPIDELDELLGLRGADNAHETSDDDNSCGRVDDDVGLAGSPSEDGDGRDVEARHANERANGKSVRPAGTRPLRRIEALQAGPCAWTQDIPVAFEPPAVPPYPFDAQDSLIPEPGFISDFCYSMKGKESPTIFNIFAALFTLAVMTSRRSTFRWALGGYYPNVYMLIVAPPAICTKTTAVAKGHKLLKRLPTWFMAHGDTVMAEEKTLECITSSATPGGIMKRMAPKESIFILPDGTIHRENFGSRAFVWAEEFATFLSTQHYAEGLTNALTKWYDCQDEDGETFKGESNEPLKDIYFNLAGALTPMHLQRSLPEEAFTGGFMSRVIIVNQTEPVAFFPEPIDYDGFPTMDTLTERLAYVAYNCRGEYYWTSEAKVFYENFYMESKRRYIEAGSDFANMARARHVHVVKRIAMLLRISEYRAGREITLENLQQAITLLEFTYTTSQSVNQLIGASPERKNYLKTRTFIKKNGSVTRGKLLKRMSRNGCLKDEVNSILSQLKQEGLIDFVLNGSIKSSEAPSTNIGEEYRWIGALGAEDEEGDN